MTQLRLLLKFANYDSGKRDEIEFEDTATVGQLKEHILNEHWPSNDAGVPKLNYATPVHIAVSQKAMRKAGGLEETESCCIIQ